MSFDVFLWGFHAGEVAEPTDGGLVIATLQRFVIDSLSAEDFQVRTADGDSAVHGLDDAGTGLMFNHSSGQVIWDAIVAVAKAADFVIVPVGCATCVTHSDQIADLPAELAHDVRVVTSGAELRDVIQEP